LVFELLLLLCLILLSGFFSATETALFSFSQTEMLQFQKSSNRRQNLAAKILQTPDQVLTSILLGNNAVNIMIVLVAGSLFQQFPLENYGILIRTEFQFALEILVIASILLIFGEILPKTIALKHPRQIIQTTILPFFLFHKGIGLLRVRQLAAMASQILFKAVRWTFGDKDEYADRSDIQKAVELGRKGGQLSREEAVLLDNVLKLKNISSTEIMQDRSKVVTLDPDTNIREAVLQSINHSLEVLPVYDKNKDKIIGVFDAAKAVLENHKGKIQEFMETPLFIPMVNISEILLDMLREQTSKLAVVVDEFGAYSGIISHQDIADFLTKSLVMWPAVSKTKGIKDTESGWTIDADVKLETVEELLAYKFPKGEYLTLGGLLTDLSGKIPRKNEWLVVEGWKFYIDEARPNKIVRVFIQKKGS
jgi:putative hemolysin